MSAPAGGHPPSGLSTPSNKYTSLPALAGRPQGHQSSTAASSSAMDDHFTPQMRDRQARGKDPYHSGDGSDGGNLSDRDSRTGSKLRLGKGRAEKEDYARVERRQQAIAFLDNPELLIMYAQSTGDTVPAARLHFTKMLCGYDE